MSNLVETETELPDGSVRFSLFDGGSEVAALEVLEADGILVINSGHWHAASGCKHGQADPGCRVGAAWLKTIVDFMSLKNKNHA